MRAFVLAMVLLSVNTASAQPFGIPMGAKKETLNIERELSPFRFKVKVLKSHSEFESVIATITLDQGVCKVAGIGVTHENDSFGISIRAATDTIKDQVAMTYGQNTMHNFLQTGSIWKGEHYWTMAVSKVERFYQMIWKSSVSKPLPNNVARVTLDVSALSSEDTYLTLAFKYKNWDACKMEQQKAAAQIF